MKKIILLFAMCVHGTIQAHEFEEIGPSFVLVDSFELTGLQIWDYYFSMTGTFLVAYRPNQSFQLINHPQYQGKNTPESMRVCVQQDEGPRARCNDPFYHVHTDQFLLGRSVAEDMCNAYSATAVVEYVLPDTFVSGDGSPYYLHHSTYRLFHGIKFNCWIDTATPI